MSSHVFRKVADVVMHQFAAGDISQPDGSEILSSLACALVDEGWCVKEMDHLIAEYAGWPMIIKAIRSAQEY